MNNSTYLNASDPNSMKDLGPCRNGIYNFRLTNVPKISDSTFSKTFGMNDEDILNKTFYAAGSKTSIKNHLGKQSE